MYKFSNISLDNLNSCHPFLKELAHRVMDLQIFDFGITCGFRDKSTQNDYYHKGSSAVMWPKSKHNQYPSKAMDIVLWVNGKVDWHNKESWYMAIGVFRGVAAMMDINIRVGADWDGDFHIKDQWLHDLGHIELIDKTKIKV